MPDISMCTNTLCPSKEYCYRFTAIPSYRQSYTSFNIKQNADICDMFWSNGKCTYCNQENGIHKLSCATHKMQIRL
jgi:hypothetical protein